MAAFSFSNHRWQSCSGEAANGQSVQPATMPSISRTIPRVQTATHISYRANDNLIRRNARSFTTSKPACAVPAQSQMPKNIIRQMPPQQGLRSRMKNLSRHEIPNDLGLIPQTLIRPPRHALPKLFSANWRQRLKFEWSWTRTRFQNFFTYAMSLGISIVHS